MHRTLLLFCPWRGAGPLFSSVAVSIAYLLHFCPWPAAGSLFLGTAVFTLVPTKSCCVAAVKRAVAPTHLDVSIDEVVEFEVVVIFTEGVDERLSHFEPPNEEHELQHEEKRRVEVERLRGDDEDDSQVFKSYVVSHIHAERQAASNPKNVNKL